MFKKAIIAASLLLSSSSFASTYFEYDQKSVQLAGALSHCPGQLGELQDMSDYLGSATFMAPRPSSADLITNIYSVNGISGGYWGGPAAKVVATLVVTQVIDSRDLRTDAPARVSYSCELVARD